MFIDINTLGPEGLAFDHRLSLRGLEGPSREPLADVQAHLWGSVTPTSGGEAELTARLEAPIALQCGRCLESFDWTARAAIDLTVVRNVVTHAEPVDLASDETPSTFIAPEGRLDLEQVATEQLYLSFPLKPICTPACRGLCPQCGTNRNLEPCSCVVEEIDPRLAPLLPFRQKKAQES